MIANRRASPMRRLLMQPRRNAALLWARATWLRSDQTRVASAQCGRLGDEFNSEKMVFARRWRGRRGVAVADRIFGRWRHAIPLSCPMRHRRPLPAIIENVGETPTPEATDRQRQSSSQVPSGGAGDLPTDTERRTYGRLYNPSKTGIVVPNDKPGLNIRAVVIPKNLPGLNAHEETYSRRRSRELPIGGEIEAEIGRALAAQTESQNRSCARGPNRNQNRSCALSPRPKPRPKTRPKPRSNRLQRKGKVAQSLQELLKRPMGNFRCARRDTDLSCLRH